MHEITFFFPDDALKITFSLKSYRHLDLLLHQHICDNEFIIVTKHPLLIISFKIFLTFLFYFIWKTYNCGHKLWDKYQIFHCFSPSFPLCNAEVPFWQLSPIFFLCNIEKEGWENSKQILAQFCRKIFCPRQSHFLKKIKIVSIGNVFGKLAGNLPSVVK